MESTQPSPPPYRQNHPNTEEVILEFDILQRYVCMSMTTITLSYLTQTIKHLTITGILQKYLKELGENYKQL